MSTSSKTTNTSQQYSQQTNPWAPQGAALTDAFGKAQGAYSEASKAVVPDNFTALSTPEQLATFRAMIGHGSETSLPEGQASAAGALTRAGVTGTQGALSGYAGFDPTATNNPEALVSAANKYVAGQNIDAQVADAMLNARQTARDVTLPGINQGAAITGNTNSSRTGIAEGLVERGLAEQSTNLGASLRSKAFADGLSLARQQSADNAASRLAALSGQGALSTAAGAGGNTAANSAISNTGALDTLRVAGGAGLQSAEQDALTNAFQRFQFGTQAPYENLKQLMAIIGSGNWGSSSAGTSSGTANEESKPALTSIIAGALGGATSLFGEKGFNVLGGWGQKLLGSK